MSAVEPFEIMPDIDTQSALEKHLKNINRQVRSVGMLTMKEYRRAYRLWCHEVMPLAQSRRHAAPIDFDDPGMERCFTLAPDFSEALISGDEEKAQALAYEIARVVESCIAKRVRERVADILIEVKA